MESVQNNMKIKLICEEKSKDAIHGILNANGIDVDEEADLVMVEKGLQASVSSDSMMVCTVGKLAEMIDSLKTLAYEAKPISMIIGKHQDAYHPVDVKNIVYVNAINNNVYIHDIQGQSYLIKQKLYQLEFVLPEYFIRINKSEIVNIKRIEMIIPMFKGKLIVQLQSYKNPLDISRAYSKAFKERLGL